MFKSLSKKILCLGFVLFALFSSVAVAEIPVFPANLYNDLCEHPDTYLSKQAILYGKVEAFTAITADDDALILLSLSDDVPGCYVQIYLEHGSMLGFPLEIGNVLRVESIFLGNIEQPFLPDVPNPIPYVIAGSIMQDVGLPVSTLPVECYDLSLTQLVSLKNRLSLSIQEIVKWQEIKLRPGLHKVGEDIPAGRYSLQSMYNRSAHFAYGSILDDQKAHVSSSSPDYIYDLLQTTSLMNLELKEGSYIELMDNLILFSPYVGENP